ncbi:MAG TPA: hypothetical protein VGP47_02615 [Parachlamydiaceae bacterium]|nr:hypothetical protein [Parachlamydiaceae bacterium]
MGLYITSPQALQGMQSIGKNVSNSINIARDSIVTALPRGSITVANIALGVISINKVINFCYTPFNLQRTLIDFGMIVIVKNIVDYIENQKTFSDVKHKIQAALIIEGKKNHPEWVSKSDVEFLESIELKIPGGIDYLTKAALAVQKNERDQVISSLTQQLIST